MIVKLFRSDRQWNKKNTHPRTWYPPKSHPTPYHFKLALNSWNKFLQWLSNYSDPTDNEIKHTHTLEPYISHNPTQPLTTSSQPSTAGTNFCNDCQIIHTHTQIYIFTLNLHSVNFVDFIHESWHIPNQSQAPKLFQKKTLHKPITIDENMQRNLLVSREDQADLKYLLPTEQSFLLGDDTCNQNHIYSSPCSWNTGILVDLASQVNVESMMITSAPAHWNLTHSDSWSCRQDWIPEYQLKIWDSCFPDWQMKT